MANSGPSGSNPFGYKGQAGYLTDGIDVTQPSGVDLANNTGLIYCQHRYYDPYAGRWISRDPTGLEGGENAYEFCDGNPLMLVDPSGLDAFPYPHERTCATLFGGPVRLP